MGLNRVVPDLDTLTAPAPQEKTESFYINGGMRHAPDAESEMTCTLCGKVGPWVCLECANINPEPEIDESEPDNRRYYQWVDEMPETYIYTEGNSYDDEWKDWFRRQPKRG